MFNENSTFDLGGFQYRQQALRSRLDKISDLHRTKLGLQGGRPTNLVMGRASASPVAAGGGDFEKFLNSIAQQESGGNYGARGIRTRWGTALGKYQILDSNLSAWGRQALGRSISAQEFLRSPQLQEQIARFKLKEYYDKYGAAGAAKAWYGGEGAARRSSNRRNNGGRFPSLNSYASSVVSRLR